MVGINNNNRVNTFSSTGTQSAQSTQAATETAPTTDAAPLEMPELPEQLQQILPVDPREVGAVTRSGDLNLMGNLVQAQVGKLLANGPGAIEDAKKARATEASYRKAATTDLTDPKTLTDLNAEMKKVDPNAAPVTDAEVKELVKKTDVKSLSEADYKTLKVATGGQPGNPASNMTADERKKLRDVGAENLAKDRVKGEGREPTADEIRQARADLQKIDPGAFTDPVKDAIYVNQKAAQGQGDPTQTRVATHEYTHLLLAHRGIPEKAADGTDNHHKVTGGMGWNGVAGSAGVRIDGEMSEYRKPPGSPR